MLFWAALAAGGIPLDEGLEAFRKRDFTTAERLFQQAVREHPTSRAYKLLGMTYAAQEHYAQAEQPFRKACALDPKEENACYYLGRNLFTQSKLAESRQAFEKALATGHDIPRVQLGMGLTLEAMGDAAGAERYYKLAIAGGETQARVDYGLFLFKQNRGGESLEMLRLSGDRREFERVQQALAKQTPTGPAQVVTPVEFAATELPMVVRTGGVGEKHLIETMIAGVAVFDFNNDGWPDIFVANGAEIPSLVKPDASYWNRLYRNNGDGTFTDVTERAGLQGEGYSMGAAAGDYDGDGNVDLLVTGVRGSVLYRNAGGGKFEKAAVLAGPWTVAAGWFDYDGDGRLDLFLVRYVEWDAAKETYCGAPEPGRRQFCHPKYYAPLANALYHNEGGGKFRDVSVESGIAAHKGKGMGLAFGDADGDGRLDVFVANDTMPNFLFHNEGGGKFREIALEAGVALNDDGKALSSMGVEFRDYDNDGREDIFFTALSNETFPLFRNLGSARARSREMTRFADMTYPSGIGKASMPWTGWSVGMFDFNNDGRKDIFYAGGHVMDNAEVSSGRKSRQANGVFLNRGGGKFELTLLPGEALHRGAAFGDFDRDGRMDVVVTRLNEKPLVLRNVTRGAGHWLELDVRPSAVGARVHLVSASGEQWNRVTTAMGYGASSDLVTHFGLGADTMVRRIEIEWPGGGKAELAEVKADRVVKIPSQY